MHSNSSIVTNGREESHRCPLSATGVTKERKPKEEHFNIDQHKGSRRSPQRMTLEQYLISKHAFSLREPLHHRLQ